MNSKQLKSNKKRELSAKSFVFWGIMAAIVVFLLTLLIIRIAQKKDITSYDKVDALVGQEVFTQKDESYFVLAYDYKKDEAMEDFDKTVFHYLTFVRDNSNASKTGAYKLYKFDTTNKVNATCIGEESDLTGATTFPSPNQKFNEGSTSLLQIANEDLPILLVVSGGSVTNYYKGVTDILTFLNSLITK